VQITEEHCACRLQVSLVCYTGLNKQRKPAHSVLQLSLYVNGQNTILDKTLCHLRNVLLLSESILTTDAKQSIFLTQLFALRGTDASYIQLFKKPNREQCASNVTPSNRTRRVSKL